jgi:release factor glutamine methyltransferase
MTDGLSIAEALSKAAVLTDSDSPDLDVRLLLQHVTGFDDMDFWLRPEKRLTPENSRLFMACLERRLQGEPVAYITGSRGFWTLTLEVTPDVLVPRVDTERLVQAALDHVRYPRARVLELATGSGAVVLALASERPDWQFAATDISASALAVARRNASRYNQCIDWFQGDWFAPLPKGRSFDLILANPPYINPRDPHLDRGDLRHEPRHALASGRSGMADLETIISAAPDFLQPGGWLMVEHGHDQGQQVMDLMRAEGFGKVACIRDFGQQDRVSLGCLPVDG